MGILRDRQLRILAADDSAVMRSVLLKLFLMHAEDRQSDLPRMELCGVARDGAECLELVDQLRPDVLVLDLEMPKLNGLEVLDRLRLLNPQLPVIMCSAYTEHGARSTLEALGRGASDYVTKPSEQRNFACGDAVAFAAVAAANRRPGKGREKGRRESNCFVKQSAEGGIQRGGGKDVVSD